MYATQLGLRADILDRLIAAINGQSTSSVVECFVEHAQVDAFGMIFTGREEIMEWSDGWVVGRGVTLSDAISLPDGRGIAVRAQMHATPLEGGVTLNFTFDGALIALLRLSR
jgi:hypothetical protein